MQIDKTGRFISATEHPYDFKNQKGEHIVGSTLRLWFSWGEQEEPSGIRVRASEDWEAARTSLEFGDWVTVEAEVQARNNTVEFSLVSLERFDANEADDLDTLEHVA